MADEKTPADSEVLLAAGDRGVFRSPYTTGTKSVASVRSIQGMGLTVLRVVTEPGGGYDEDPLPMYEIRLDDGLKISAYPEEVHRA
jgi:hypothetical protein